MGEKNVMKIEYISLTNHALKRWIERVGPTDPKDIVETIKQCKAIEKKDLFITRTKNTTYLRYENNIIVLKEEDEKGKYTFVTIVKEDYKEKVNFRRTNKKKNMLFVKKSEKKEKPRNCKKKRLGRVIAPEISEFYD